MAFLPNRPKGQAQAPATDLAAEKNSFLNFWKLYFRKFWDLLSLNMLFAGFTVPFFVGSFLIFEALLKRMPVNLFYLTILLSFAPFALYGPVLSGMTLITREYTRGVPTFLWKDFWGCIRKNWKQTLSLSVVGYLLIVLITNACMMYRTNFSVGLMQKAFFYISLLMLVVVLFANFYVYMMSVTLKLTFRQLCKNALLFAFLGLLRNLLIVVALAAYTAVAAVLLWYAATVSQLLYPLFFFYLLFVYFSLCGYTVSYLVFPMVRKYAIEPYYRDHPEETAEAVNDPQSIFHNIGTEISDQSQSEYVYENGKMVHRSVLERVREFEERGTEDADKSGE